jgi:hypothetical protein
MPDNRPGLVDGIAAETAFHFHAVSIAFTQWFSTRRLERLWRHTWHNSK